MIEWKTIRRESVASTMDEIDAMGEAGAASGTVVVADEQTSGRGRAGRTWQAPPGSGLFLSILFRSNVAARDLSSLPLVVGLAVAESIETAAGIECRLKWPNDVLIDRGKVAGVLVATKLSGDRVRFANIGIGVNCASAAEKLPYGAVSILSATRCLVAPRDLLPILLVRLGKRLEEFETMNGRPSLAEWWSRAAFRYEMARVENDGAEIEGVIDGIDADGTLLMTTRAGERTRIVAGDLSRGPRSIRDS